MNLIELSKYLQDEQAAENYLYEKGILKKYTECPHCGFDKLGHLSRNRIKCYKCKKEWHKRKGSFLEGKKILDGSFIGYVKLFVSGFSTNNIAHELKLDYKTVNELNDRIRSIIISKHFPNISLSENEYYLFQKDQSNNSYVSLCEISNKIIENNKQFPYGKLTIVRTKTYDDLLTFTFDFSWSRKTNKRKIYEIDRFLSYLSERLHSYRGVNIEKFMAYFVENLIRFNVGIQAFFFNVTEGIKSGG